MQQIEGKLKRRLLEIVKSSKEREACGLLLEDGRVRQLPNHSEQPQNNFVVTKHDIIAALKLEEVETLEGLTFWHSHPGGGIGPSRVDLQQKMPFSYHLVLSLVDGDIVPTWY